MNNEGVILLFRIISVKLNFKKWFDIGNCCFMVVSGIRISFEIII